MSDQASIGYGILLKRGDGATPEVFTTISGLTKPALPNIKRDSIDATDTESPNRYREFIPGLLDAGELALEFEERLGDTNQLLLDTDLNNPVLRNYQMVAPDNASTTWSFTGFITNIDRSPAPIDGKMMKNVTFKISGKPALA